jgi:N4-gp56 family major capsid protein
MATLDGATSRGASEDITAAASFIPTLWSDEILRARDKALVMVDKIMHVKPMGLKYGSVVNIPTLGNETALDKTAGSAITFAAATDTTVNININKYKYVGKLIEDVVAIQSKYDLFTEFSGKIAKALASVVDSDILALTASCAYSVGTASSVALSGVITTAAIVAANRYLDIANAPQEDRYMVVDAYGREDLLNIESYIRYDAGGKTPAPVNSGIIGELYGIKVLFSNNVASSASVAYGMVFHKDAMAIALQKDVTMKSEYSVDYIGQKMVGYELYGVTMARTDHAVLLRYAQA